MRPAKRKGMGKRVRIEYRCGMSGLVGDAVLGKPLLPNLNTVMFSNQLELELLRLLSS